MSEPQQQINVGQVANDGTGESLRDAFNAVNNNFANVWAAGPVDTQVVITNNRISTNETNLDLILAGNGVGNVTVASTTVPSIDAVYDLGRANRRFDEVHAVYYYGNGAYLTGITGNGGGGPNVFFSQGAPGNASIGDIWIESDTGVQYLYFNDDTSNQWAEMEAYQSFSSGGNGTANTGNWGFAGNNFYNLNGGNIFNGDLTHGYTAGITIPTNGDANAILLNNTYGNIILQAGTNSDPTATWIFDNNGVITADGNLKLAPDSTNAGSYLDIFLTSGPDLHLVASASANLILGKDNGANVMTSWNGNAYVQSWNQNTGNVGGIWTFGGDGGTIFPTLTVQRGDNPSGTITGQTLSFGDPSQEAIISTADGTASNEYSQRLVINPGQGYDYGEGGDIYLWAGRGGNGSGSGGDIKIRGGQGGANTTGGVGGSGGYIRIEAGDSATTGGAPGYIDINGGVNYTGAGGYVDIRGGQGQTIGGDANITGGYGFDDRGGNVNIWGGGSGNGQSNEGNVNIQTGGNTWTFDPSGNLTLPAGGSIYSEGFTPSGNPGNTITLNPHGSGSITNQKLLVYPTAGDGDHIHLTSGNLYQTELFLGSDNLFVKLANTGNIVINSDDNAGNTAQWKFGIDGNLTASGNLIIAGNTNVFGTDSALIQPTDDKPLIALSSGANGAVSSVWVEDIGNVGTSNIASVYANPIPGSGIVRIAVGQNGGSGPNLWDFNANGTITLPASSGQIGLAGYTNGIDLYNNNGGTGYVRMNYADESLVWADPGGSHIQTTGGTWDFDTTGNTAFPNGAVFTGYDLYAAANSYIELAGSNDNTYVGLDNTSVFIQTDWNNSQKQWTFDSAGNLTLPNGAVLKDTSGDSVSFGQGAGQTTQGEQAVAIGLQAGFTSQGNYAVAIGKFSANSSQGSYAVAVGPNAGYENQLANAVSIGASAGASSQGINSVAVGVNAAYNTQGNNAVAVGNSAAYLLQGSESVAIGVNAGIYYLGNNAIAIGANAGNNLQGNNSIIFNATGSNLRNTTANTFTVAPVRNDVANTGQVVFYNTSSNEITYGNTISVAGNVSGNYFIGNGSQLSSVATQVTGSWTLAAGTNTVSLSVPGPGTYSIWVNGNIPNGIVTYTATVVVTNTNVPVVGTSYGWYYAAGNALVLTAIPTQIVGSPNSISTAVVATTTANVFTFGITNNSGSSQVVSYGYTKL